MAINYAYNYAIIDMNTNMCISVQTTTSPVDPEECPNYVEIPVYDGNYLFKYYLNGNWYVDAAGTIPWTSSLL